MRARFAAVAVIFAASVVFGQLKESVTVSVVEVPVTVVDRAGNPIKGLTRENFEVIDEGKKREISSLDSIDFSSIESVSLTSPLNPAARRNFLLVFDLTFSSPNSISRARQGARDFVTKMVEKRDRVGVATVDVDHGFRFLTAFTTDRNLVDAAIANPATFHGNDPLQLAGMLPIEQVASTTGADANSNGIQKNQAAGEINDMVKRAGKAEDQYNRQRIDRQVNLLAGLTKALRAVNGQKHIVLLSEGFDPRLIQGRDAGINSDQVTENAAVERGEIWNVDNDNRFGSSTSMSLVDRLTEVAKRSDVILDTVDIRGIRTDSDAAAAGYSHKSNEGLHLLANATGGTVFKNANNLATDFQRVVKAQEVVYVLAFTAPTSQPGKFHNLKVRLVNAPSGARATYRAGYYEAGTESSVERTLSNAEIIIGDIRQDAIHVSALTAPFPTRTANAQVPVILEINGRDLAEGVKGNTASTEIFVYAFDEQGLVRDSLYQRMGVDLEKVGSQLRSSGIKYYGTLSLPEGKYAVKTLVRIAESDRKGYVRSDVVVPRPSDTSLSQPFFFEEPGKWLMVKGGTHDKSNSGYPFEVNGEPFIPSAMVRVHNGEARKFAVFVQNATPDEITLDTNPKAKLVSQLKSANGSKFVFQLDGPIGNVATLDVTAKKNGSTIQQTSSVGLVVQ
jgi:VWFA-related protein